MAELVSWQIRSGVWRGLVASTDPPEVSIRSGSVTLDQVKVQPDSAGIWRVEASIPRDMISDGVHGFTVSDEKTGEQLGAFTLAVGAVAGGNLVAEVAQLRTEIEILKTAFRRQNRGD